MLVLLEPGQSESSERNTNSLLEDPGPGPLLAGPLVLSGHYCTASQPVRCLRVWGED